MQMLLFREGDNLEDGETVGQSAPDKAVLHHHADDIIIVVGAFAIGQRRLDMLAAGLHLLQHVDPACRQTHDTSPIANQLTGPEVGFTNLSNDASMARSRSRTLSLVAWS